MQAQTKQRILGGLVLLAIVSLSLPLLFNHPLPGLTKPHLSDNVPTPPSTPSYVYDIPLTGQGAQRAAVNGQSQKNDFDLSTTAELRSRAAKTAAVSSHILHTPGTPGLNISKKQCVGECLGPAVSKNEATTKEVIADAGGDNARDSVVNKVSLQSEMATIPEAWVVQVASFSDADLASHLQDVLRTMGLDAFSSKVTNNQKVMVVRVFVGPFIDKVKAQQLQQQLESKIHLKGVIKKYT